MRRSGPSVNARPALRCGQEGFLSGRPSAAGSGRGLLVRWPRRRRHRLCPGSESPGEELADPVGSRVLGCVFTGDRKGPAAGTARGPGGSPGAEGPASRG